MEKLEKAQIALRALGVLCIIFGTLGILVGFTSMVDSGLMVGVLASLTNSMTAADVDTATTATGIELIVGGMLLVSGIFTLLMGIFSVHGANDFRKIIPAYVLALINLVLAILGVIACVAADGSFYDILESVFNIAFSIAIFWAAKTIKDGNNCGYDNLTPQEPQEAPKQ